MTERVAPHDMEAEGVVLGTIMLDFAASWPVASSVLSADHFFGPAHAAIWLALAAGVRAHGAGTVVDSTMVRGELSRSGKLDLAGDTLIRVTDRIPDVRNLEAHAMTVRNLAVAREVATAAAALANRAYSGQLGDLAEFLDDAERSLGKICEARSVAGELHHLNDVVVEVFEDVTARAEKGAAGSVGLSTGFEDLDRYISGVEPGLLYIIGGRPAMGKTAIGLNILRNVAGVTDDAGIFFSLEMPRTQLASRLLASESLVDSNKLRFATMVRDDWPLLATGAGKLNNLPIYIDDKTTDIDDICRIARRKKRTSGLSAIFLDYIQLCTVGGRFGNREQEIAYITRTLKLLAKELEAPIIALAQLNRGVESRPNKRPMISDLRESGAIEQDADTIIFIYRDEVYDPESPDRGLAEVIIGKQRGGETGFFKTVFRKEYTRFESYDGGRQDDRGQDPHWEDREG